MSNAILEDVIRKRQGHYCHALEVNDELELQSCIEALYDEFIVEYTVDEIVEFFSSIELYCLNDEYENDVYAFDIAGHIRSL